VQEGQEEDPEHMMIHKRNASTLLQDDDMIMDMSIRAWCVVGQGASAKSTGYFKLPRPKEKSVITDSCQEANVHQANSYVRLHYVKPREARNLYMQHCSFLHLPFEGLALNVQSSLVPLSSDPAAQHPHPQAPNLPVPESTAFVA
jgi:hypothetical protein